MSEAYDHVSSGELAHICESLNYQDVSFSGFYHFSKIDLFNWPLMEIFNRKGQSKEVFHKALPFHLFCSSYVSELFKNRS